MDIHGPVRLIPVYPWWAGIYLLGAVFCASCGLRIDAEVLGVFICRHTRIYEVDSTGKRRRFA